MRIISEKRVREFWEDANGQEKERRRKAMQLWIGVVKSADWDTFADVRETFNHSDVYGDCTIFDVGGNNYRLIAKVRYRKRIVFISEVLTHTEYDKKKWQANC